MTDNRTSTRHAVSFSVSVTIAGMPPVAAKLVNLSLGGALIETGSTHTIGQRMKIAFTIPTIDDVIEVGATVRWSDGAGVGLQFDGLRAQDVWALNEYFKQLAR